MAKFIPVSRRQVVTVEVEVPVGDGDRDISYSDSVAVQDELAGTLGPVQTQDSTVLSDEFVAEELTLQESINTSDEFREIDGPVVDESIDISDSLAGTLGPIRAPDTYDVTDGPDFGPLVLDDTVDLADVQQDSELEVDDSIDIADQLAGTLGPIRAPDSFDEADELRPSDLTVRDSIDVADQTQGTSLAAAAQDSVELADGDREVELDVQDSIDINDESGSSALQTYDLIDMAEATSQISLNRFQDSLDILSISQVFLITTQELEDLFVLDLLQDSQFETFDLLSMADARRDGDISATAFIDQQVSNTGFINPANAFNANTADGAQVSATQSGGFLGGSSVTVNGTIVGSLSDKNIVPAPTVLSARIEYGWTTTASGGLQSGNAVTMTLGYNLDDSETFTVLATVLTVAGTADTGQDLPGGLTFAQLNQIRFRAIGSVQSGTTAVTGGATQTFTLRYARLIATLRQAL